MASHPPKARVRVDDDGVRTFEVARGRRFMWMLGLAVGIPIVATIVAIVLIRLRPGNAAGPSRSQAADLAANASGAPPASAPDVKPRQAATVPDPPPFAEPVRPRRLVRAGEPRRPASATAKGERAAKEEAESEIDAREAIIALRNEGVTEGIAAFGLPGSDPPKPGIIVPEDYQLPEGFVRHYQSTDDGEQLPAILMVHPDYELVDANGASVVAPNGVVPPGLAPPGLKIEMLEVPERPGAPAAEP